MPDRARAMHAQLVAWRQAIKAPMPEPNRAIGQETSAPKKKDQAKAQRQANKKKAQDQP